MESIGTTVQVTLTLGEYNKRIRVNMDEEMYFEETVSPCSKTVMSIENLLIKEKSKYQDISVFENKVFGRVLTLYWTEYASNGAMAEVKMSFC